MSAQTVQAPRQLLVLHVRTKKSSYLRYDAEAAKKAYRGRKAKG